MFNLIFYICLSFAFLLKRFVNQFVIAVFLEIVPILTQWLLNRVVTFLKE